MFFTSLTSICITCVLQYTTCCTLNTHTLASILGTTYINRQYLALGRLLWFARSDARYFTCEPFKCIHIRLPRELHADAFRYVWCPTQIQKARVNKSCHCALIAIEVRAGGAVAKNAHLLCKVNISLASTSSMTVWGCGLCPNRTHDLRWL